MLRILIVGRDGQVGWECQRSLQVFGKVVCLGRSDCDLTSPESVRTAIEDAAPDLIINAAAYTAVDQAESEPDVARAVNADAPAMLAEHARRLGASMIHLSTDYVFDGTKPTPYCEDDVPNPLSAYGHTKLLGEQAIQEAGIPSLILRTSWVYSSRGQNYVRTILRLAREREELRIVSDQFGAPTWARSISDAIAAIVARAGSDRESIASSFGRRGGLFHMTAGGRTNWYEFATRCFAEIPDPLRRLKSIVPITAAEYPTAARRPANSVLSCARLAQHWHVELPRWDHAFALARTALA